MGNCGDCRKYADDQNTEVGPKEITSYPQGDSVLIPSGEKEEKECAGRRPAATEKQLEPDEVINAYGYVYQGTEKKDMGLNVIAFKEMDEIVGSGTDSIGSYELRGEFDSKGKVTMEQTYKGDSKVNNFIGNFGNKSIVGTYSCEGSQSNKFEISLNASLYTGVNFKIMFPLQAQFAGIYKDETGWKTMKGTKGENGEITFNLKKGESEQVIAQGKIPGQGMLQLSIGSALLFLSSA